MNAIEIRQLRKSYPGFSLGPLDLSLPQGCIVGLIGENGARKTTTIRLMTGILSPTSGRVLIDGKDMAKDPVAAKQCIGFVPDGHELYERLTGLEYLRFLFFPGLCIHPAMHLRSAKSCYRAYPSSFLLN